MLNTFSDVNKVLVAIKIEELCKTIGETSVPPSQSQ